MEDLGLKLTAQITEWVSNMDKAAKAADRLLNVVKEVEKGIQSAFAGIEAASKQSLGKSVAAFAAASAQMDKSAQAIENDATRAGVALDGMGKSAQRSAKAIDGAARDIGRSTKQIGTGAQDAARNLTSGFSGVEQQFKAVSDRVSGTVLNIRNAVLGLGALRFGQAAVDSASEFEAALGQLAIVSADTGKPIGELRQQLLDLSKTTPQALGDLTKSYATAVGSLPKGANQARVAFEALNAAQQAARASGATTEETLRGITALLNTYGDEGLTAAQITDKLFAAFDQGAATVPELTASIGQVAGIAKGFGISIDEVFGSIAVLTRGGQTASEAITNLRQALISTANGGSMDKVAGQLEKLGLSADLFSAQSLRQNGLIGVLEQVEKAGGRPILNKLFTDTQGLLAVQTLLAKGLSQTREDIDLIGKSAGKTDQAIAIIGQNFDQLAGIAKNRLGVAFIDIGERIMPTVARVLTQLADYAEKNGAAIAEGIGKAVDVLARFGEWVVQYGPPVLLFFGSLKAVSFFAGLAKDVGTATIALSGFVQQYRAASALGEGLAGFGAARPQPAFKTRFEFDSDGTRREIRELATDVAGDAATAGGKVGEKFGGGFTSKLKSLGPAISGIIRSPGLLGAAVTAGVFLGQALGDAIGKAAAEAIEGPIQREIEGNIRDLDRRIKAALAARGAATQEELDAAEGRRRRGDVVDTGGRGDIREFKALADVAAAGGDVSGATVLGLEGLEKDRQRITASLNRLRNANEEAVADLEQFNQVLQGPVKAAPGAEEVAATSRSRQEVARLGGSLEGREQRVAETRKDVEDAEKALQDLSGAMSSLATQSDKLGQAATSAGAKRAKAAVGGGKAAKAEADTFLADILKAYEDAQSKIADILLGNARIGAESAQNEAEARRAAFDAETDARVNALEDADVKESQVAELRAQRERELTGVIDQQIAAIQGVSRVRAQEAEAAAQKEIEAAKGSAETQAAIADNLRHQKEQIELETLDSIDEMRRASLARQAQIEREVAKARAEEAIRQQAIAAGINRGQTAAGKVGSFVDTLEDPVGALQRFAKERATGGGAEAAGSAIGEIVGGLAAAMGPVGAAIQAAINLPEILNGIAAWWTTGMDEFASALFDSILKVAFALVQGFPAQIEKLLNETLPKFVEALIAALPELIGSLIALLPRLVFSLAKSLAYSLPIALYDGFVKAGESLFEFFTSDIVTAIGSAIGGFFAKFGQDMAKLFSLIIPGFIKDAFAFIIKGLGNFFGGMFESLGKAFAEIGRQIASVFADLIKSVTEAIFGTDSPGESALLGGKGTARTPTGRAFEKARASRATGGASDVVDWIRDRFHQGGVVGQHSNPHMAAAIAQAGAPRFAGGGMVSGVGSLARRRLSQILSGDDVPALLAPGEGVLTARGVDAVGGPQAIDGINRGNTPGGGTAQLTISGRVGGDAALAALVSRLVSISISSPSGNVRLAMNRSNLATTIPGWAPLKPA